MGSRPEELLKALWQLQRVAGTPADQAFAIICQTLAAAAADTELRSVEDFGVLAQAIFGRIAGDKLVAANLIARPGHGRYAVVDPFVREVWRSRRALLPDGNGGDGLQS